MSISQGKNAGMDGDGGKLSIVKRLRRWWNGLHPFWARVNRTMARAHPSVTETGERSRAELRQANASVEVAGRRTQTVFQTLAEGVGVTDPSGVLVEVNDSLLRLAGYTRSEELMGKNVTVLVAEAERARMAKNISFGVEQGKAVEYKMAAADGRAYDGEITISVLQDDQGQRTGFVTVVRDITLQKQAAEAILLSEARQRQILDTIPASILITRLPAGEVLYANQTMINQFGLLPDQAAGKAIPDLFADPADWDRLLATLRDQGRLENLVALAKRQDNGQTFWGDLSGRMIDFAGERALLTAILDVTARKQAEESLLARDEVLQKHSVVIGELSRSSNITSGDLQAALGEITEAACQTLDVPRASVWFFNDGQDQIRCADLYETGKGHSAGATMNAADYRAYFTALQTATTLAVDDAHAHPSTREFSLHYLIPLGINSMLNAPILLRGRVVGVLSCEHVGPKRHWTLEEENFTTSIVDFVTAAMEAEERVNLARQIKESYERRGAQVQLSTQIAQDISTATELNELFHRVVTLVKERFGYYHTQLFRYELTQNAVVLIVGYGEVGAQMVQAHHQLPMGTGLVGTAAATGETVLRSELVNDPDWRANPLLPDTQGEIAVPIKLRGQVMGVLDVQSSQSGALTQDDRILLEGLCGQVAVAIEETRLRREMEERLQELNSLYAAMSREGWEGTNDTFQTHGYMYDRVSVLPLLPEEADPTLPPRQIETKLLQSESYVVSPLVVHGSGQIGALSVENDPAQPLSGEDLAFVEQVAEQVALALESARLFAQTQNTLAETQSLYQFSEAISRGVDINEIYFTMAHLMTEGTGLTGSWVATYDKAAGGLMGVAGVNLPPERIRAFTPITQRTPTSYAVLSRQTVIINDPLNDERMQELPEDVRKMMGKAIAVPILIGDEVQGVVAATSPIGGPDIGRREERLLEHIVTQASVAIQRAQLFTQIRDALINSQESEQLVRTIIDSTPDWIYVRDEEHRFRMANRAYADSLHRMPDDIIGKTDLELGFQEEMVKGNPEKGITGYWEVDAAVMEGEQPKNIPNDLVMLDGEMHIFNTFKAPLRDADGKVWGVLGISRDVTERERVQAAIAQRAHELSTVAELGTQISAVLDPVQMLQTVADLVKDSFALYHAHIYLLGERGDVLSLVAGAGEVGRKMAGQAWQIPLDREKSLVARAARSHQGVIVNDVRADVDFMPNELLPDTRAEMAVPLMVGERVLGVLDIQSDQVNHFTEDDVSIQTVLASQVAVALQNARTYAQTQRQAEYEALINTISQKIQSTTSVENALQVAVRELGRALGASRTSVQLSLGQADRVHPKGSKP